MVLSRRAQSMMEYIVLITIITAAIIVMLPRIKRTTQSMLKGASDQIGNQDGVEQTFNDVEKAYLVNSTTSGTTVVNNLRTEEWSKVNQTFNETSETTTTSFTNAGWSRE